MMLVNCLAWCYQCLCFSRLQLTIFIRTSKDFFMIEIKLDCFIGVGNLIFVAKNRRD